MGILQSSYTSIPDDPQLKIVHSSDTGTTISYQESSIITQVSLNEKDLK
jgi:hypothetical protein